MVITILFVLSPQCKKVKSGQMLVNKYGEYMAFNNSIIQILEKEFAKYDKPENKMDYQRWFEEE